ncbi:MAG: AraC family transcriptional regulator [Andreesenia angusta]|nr:AraC family transcriptional regulator [Andreesenia angusta]
MLNIIEAEKEIVRNLKKNNLNKALLLYRTYYSSDKFIYDNDCNILRCKKNNLICLLCCISRALEIKDCNNICKVSHQLIHKIESIESLSDLDSKGVEAIKFLNDYRKKNIAKSNNPIVNKAITYIEKNYNCDLSLEIIADEMHISKGHLSHLFIKNTGLKITQFINNVRIRESKYLLKNSNYSLSYISYICGFNNQNYFSTLFKKYENITPLEYRKKSRII